MKYREWTQDELRRKLLAEGWTAEEIGDGPIPQYVRLGSAPITAEDRKWALGANRENSVSGYREIAEGGVMEPATAATAVRERGITFGAPMVRALRREADPKWQTRRLIKPQPIGGDRIIWDRHAQSFQSGRMRDSENAWRTICCPYGKPGDRLYVREAWYVGKCADGYKTSELTPKAWKVDNGGLWYPADATEPKTPISPRGRYRNARFMPRWASRITLEITEVRAQQLQEISEEDARAEGAIFFDGRPIHHHGWRHDYCDVFPTAKDSFAHLWDSIHGTEHPWASNPWVFAISFRRIER